MYTVEFVVFLQDSAILLRKSFWAVLLAFELVSDLVALLGNLADIEVTLEHYRPIGCYQEWVEIAYE